MANNNFELLTEFFTNKIEPEVLAKYLDEVGFEYAHFNLSYPDQLTKDSATNLYYLRELRDVLLAVAGRSL